MSTLAKSDYTDYVTHSTLDDVYSAFAHLGDAKDFFYHWCGLNEWLFKAINGIRGESYDSFMLTVNKLGDKMNFPYFIAAIFLAVFFSCIWQSLTKKAGVRTRLIMWFGVFSVMCVGFVTEAFIIHILKDYFEFPRPYVVYPPADVNLLEIRGAEDAYRSFPSGHAAFITLMVMSMWPALSLNLRRVGLLAIASVAWARISLGVHFPADVLGGFLIATLVVIIVRHVIYTVYRKLFGLHCG